MCRCNRLKDIINAEKSVILHHIDRHKWFNSIVDQNIAIADFASKYAWLMREVFCGMICAEHESCEAAKNIRVCFSEEICREDLESFVKRYCAKESLDVAEICFRLVRRHINIHKWIHGISCYDEAVFDFIGRFGWLVSDLLCLSKTACDRCID